MLVSSIGKINAVKIKSVNSAPVKNVFNGEKVSTDKKNNINNKSSKINLLA